MLVPRPRGGGMRRLTAGVGLDRDGSEGRLFSEVYDLASEIQRPPSGNVFGAAR